MTIQGALDFSSLLSGDDFTPVTIPGCKPNLFIAKPCAPVPSTQGEMDEIRRIAQDLDDSKPIAQRLDEFGRECAAQRPELAELPFPHYGSTRQEMERILAANPGMSREDAFFQAVMEIAEVAP